jgi:ribosomal-protein-alanine N-acetyltransferase
MSVLTAPTTYSLRWIISSDVPDLAPLAEQCQALQWSNDDFRECFRSVDTIGKVAEVDGAIAGFLVYKLDHDLHEVFVKNVAVAPAWQRHGVGRALIRSLDSKLSQSYARISAIVPESNLPALYLLRDAGYRAVRILRNWFDDQDAYLMQKGRDENE